MMDSRRCAQAPAACLLAGALLARPPQEPLVDWLPRLADRAAATLPSAAAAAGSALPVLRVGENRLEPALARVRRTDIVVATASGQDLDALWIAFQDHEGTVHVLLETLARGEVAGPATATFPDPAATHVPIDLAPGQRRQLAFALRAAAAPEPWAVAAAALQARVARWDALWRDGLALQTDPPPTADAFDALAVALVGSLDPATGLAGRAGDPTAVDQLGAVIGFLRLGCWPLARGVLAAWHDHVRASGQVADSFARTTAADGPVAIHAPTMAAWLVIAHYWYLRATGDTATVRAHWPLLETCVKRLPREQEILVGAAGDEGRRWHFDASLLFLHAVGCIGGMLDRIDRVEHPDRWRDGAPATLPGAAWHARFLELLGSVEDRFWSEAQGRFAAAIARDGRGTLPASCVASNLLPAWCGMLTTTGDRTLRNVRTALQAQGAPAPWIVLPDPFPTAARIAGQVLVDDPRDPSLFAPLLALAEHRGTSATPWQLGCAIDALGMAWTGLRIATGPGLDEDWVRVRPALPPGCRTLTTRNLRHDGWLADLWLEAREGAFDAAERAADDARPAGERSDRDAANPRTHFVLVMRSPDPPAGSRLGLVHCEGTQFQDHLRRDVPMAGSALRRPPADGRR